MNVGTEIMMTNKVEAPHLIAYKVSFVFISDLAENSTNP